MEIYMVYCEDGRLSCDNRYVVALFSKREYAINYCKKNNTNPFVTYYYDKEYLDSELEEIE